MRSIKCTATYGPGFALLIIVIASSIFITANNDNDSSDNKAILMAPQDPQTAALLAHVVSQIEQNVNFLASQNYISQSDASTILNKLPNPQGATQNTGGIAGITSRMSNMMGRTPAPAPRAVPAAPSLPQARALWAYKGDVSVIHH